MANEINARNTVLSMLTDTLEEGEFSHKVLNRYLEHNGIGEENKRFINNLYSGTLERIVFADYLTGLYSKQPISKIKPLIKNILRMSIYQIFFMDSVPDRAAVSEALKLCDKRKLSGLKPFVNGVLRNICRNKEIETPDYVRNSCPQWIYDMVVSEYGKDKADNFFEATLNSDNEMTVRLMGDDEKMNAAVESLKKEGCEVKHIEGFDKAVKIKGFKNLTELKAFKEGSILPQDLSSMLVAECVPEMAGRKGGECLLIIDVCAAPGGKSIDIADRFPDANVISMDISKEKISLIEENIERLNIKNIEPVVNDAREALAGYKTKADIVICDLPCSGLGVIGRKPDIKLRLKEGDIKELAALQKDILRASSEYVKPEGILLYSTCTITREENIENMRWFTENHPFEPIPIDTASFGTLLNEEQIKNAEGGYIQLLSGINDTDGFFIALFKHK